MGGKARRTRRSAAEARELILDAAETELSEHGPDGLRLQALARAVGVSHPAILHHFGSRTGLMEAVIERASRRLTEEVTGAVANAPIDIEHSSALLEKIFAVFADRGRARTLAWLFMTRPEEATFDPGAHLAAVATAIHRQRESRLGARTPPFDDTLFTVLLASHAIVGSAVAGASLRRSAGLPTLADHQRFIAWLARLLHEHLEGER